MKYLVLIHFILIQILIYGLCISSISCWSGNSEAHEAVNIRSTIDVNSDGYILTLNNSGNKENTYSLTEFLLINPDGQDISTIALEYSDYFQDVTSFALDSSENIYVGATFAGTINFTKDIEYSSNGEIDVLLLKYDNNGNLLWVNSYGGLLTDRIENINIDSNDNIIIWGWSVEIGDDGYVESSKPEYFVARYSSDGSYINDTIMDSSIACMEVDDSSNLYIGSSHFFIESPDNNVNYSDHELGLHYTITKLNENYEEIWELLFKPKSPDGFVTPISMIVDSNTNVYVAGQCEGDVEISGSNLEYGIGPFDEHQAFLCSINSNGELLWFKNWNVNEGMIWDLGIDKNDNIYTTGTYFPEPAFIEHETINNPVSSTMYFCKFDNDGNPIYMRNWGGNVHGGAFQILLDDQSNIIIFGIANGIVDFDPNNESNDDVKRANSDFIVKFNLEGEFIWVKAGEKDLYL